MTKAMAFQIARRHKCRPHYSGKERTLFIHGDGAAKAALEILKKHPSFKVQTESGHIHQTKTHQL